MSSSKVCLTGMSHAGGCGCKIDPTALKEILANVPRSWDSKDLLIGIDHSDDAAVMRIDDERAMIFSTDFQTPIVDDPAIYGQIATANALSDIYAMGGRPILANSIVGFPVDEMPMESMQDIMEGATTKCREAGVPLAGGHSIVNQQPIFGLAVIGMAQTRHIKANSGARPDDVLILTKPVGLGVLASAIKTKTISEEGLATFIRYATQLNAAGAWLGEQDGVHAMTDVTGFGLAGHLMEMAHGAKATFKINTPAIPVLPEVLDLVREGVVPSLAYRTAAGYANAVAFDDDFDMDEQLIYADPQTNGGLLFAADPSMALTYVRRLREMGHVETTIIGRVETASDEVAVRFTQWSEDYRLEPSFGADEARIAAQRIRAAS